jgi:hypothetical protein
VPQAPAVLPGWQVPLWQHWAEVQQEEEPHAVVPLGHTHVPFKHTREPGHVTGVVPQMLLTQVACWHRSVGVGQSVAVWQQPGIGWCSHWPVIWLQVSTVQMLPSSQFLGLPVMQTPAWQVSPTVQALPSSQAVPSALLRTPQVLFAWQKASWQSVTATVEQSWSLVQLTQPVIRVPAQMPPVHMSFSVQELLSSQPVPLGRFWTSHTPVCGLQTLTVHWLPVSGHVVRSPAWQVPFWQVSPTVHRSPSSHGVPLAAFWVMQLPLVGSQTATKQGSFGCGHSLGCPGVQTPAWQVSFTVQALLSALQPVSLGLFSTMQKPSGPHTAWWH